MANPETVHGLEFTWRDDTNATDWHEVADIIYVENDIVLRGELRIRATLSLHYQYHVVLFNDDCELSKSGDTETLRELSEIIRFAQNRAVELFQSTMMTRRKAKAQERRDQRVIREKVEALHQFIHAPNKRCTCGHQ